MRQNNGKQRPFITAIVLAAGLSTRMKSTFHGTHKLNLQFPDGKTIFEQTLENLLLTPINHIIIVSNPDFSISLGTYPPSQTAVEMIFAANPASGMGTSIAEGIRHSPAQTDAWLIMPADMPFVRPKTIFALVEKFRTLAATNSIVAPHFKGKRGNPVIFGTSYKQDLTKLSGDTGGKKILVAHPEKVYSLEVQDEGIFMDIDTKQDWERYLEHYSKNHLENS